MGEELKKRDKQEVQSTSAEQLVDAANAYSPDVDIYDNGDALVFYMDMPGVAKGNVSIEVDENNVLSVRGKTAAQEPGGMIARQFNTGDYFRAFSLSDDFDKDKISAVLENGELQLTVPRREEAKPKKVQISA